MGKGEKIYRQTLEERIESKKDGWYFWNEGKSIKTGPFEFRTIAIISMIKQDEEISRTLLKI